jgi:hypothetical protein
MNEHFPDHEQLREDLEEVLGETPEPSSELRASVLEYASRRKRRRTPAPRWRIPAAAATLVAAAALVILVTRPDAPVPMLETGRLAEAEMPMADAPAQKSMMRAAPAPSAESVQGDLNADGQVNILDAWRLSRAIDSGAGQGQGDFDADGEVSPDDLDRLMQQIVSVRGGAS